jgi:hypothetical protein
MYATMMCDFAEARNLTCSWAKEKRNPQSENNTMFSLGKTPSCNEGSVEHTPVFIVFPNVIVAFELEPHASRGDVICECGAAAQLENLGAEQEMPIKKLLGPMPSSCITALQTRNHVRKVLSGPLKNLEGFSNQKQLDIGSASCSRVPGQAADAFGHCNEQRPADPD